MPDNVHTYMIDGGTYQLDHTAQTVYMQVQEAGGPTFVPTGGSYMQMCNDVIGAQLLGYTQSLLTANPFTQITDLSNNVDAVLSALLVTNSPGQVASLESSSTSVGQLINP